MWLILTILNDLVDTFLNSMEMDLNPTTYDESKYEKYILGSAQVVGLLPEVLEQMRFNITN